MADRDTQLLAATALLSGNPALLSRAGAAGVGQLDDDLREALRDAIPQGPRSPSRLVRLASALPVPVQFVAQRLVLMSPRLARAILRRTGLHHQLY